MEKLREELQNIGFSIEKNLWKHVFFSPEARGLLENPNKSPLITIIGTDSNLSLTREILKTNPKSFVSVVDSRVKDLSFIEKQENLRLCPVNALCADLIDTLKPQDMIIAKHSIHLVDSVDFISHIAPVLKDGGLFFASAPLFADRVTSSKFNQGKCQLLHSGMTFLREEPLRFFGGTVFVFVKGISSSSVESTSFFERVKRNLYAIPDSVLERLWNSLE